MFLRIFQNFNRQFRHFESLIQHRRIVYSRFWTTWQRIFNIVYLPEWNELNWFPDKKLGFFLWSLSQGKVEKSWENWRQEMLPTISVQVPLFPCFSRIRSNPPVYRWIDTDATKGELSRIWRPVAAVRVAGRASRRKPCQNKSFQSCGKRSWSAVNITNILKIAFEISFGKKKN